MHAFTLLIASFVVNISRITTFMLRTRELILLSDASMAAIYLLVAVSLIPRLISREIISSSAFPVNENRDFFLCNNYMQLAKRYV